MLASSATSFSREKIHIWHTILTPITLKFAEEALYTLSAKELETLNSFLYNKDKYLYCLSHTMLRYILAKYLNRPPCQIKFKCNSFGKPYLLDNEFYFNMSHTKNHVVIVLGHTEIGVDIEFKRPIRDCEGIAENIFTKQELELLTNKDRKEFYEVFYDLWTRKEAFVKATGYGLSIAQNTDVRNDVQKIHLTNYKTTIWRIERLILPYSRYSANMAYLSDLTEDPKKKTYFDFDPLI